MCRFLAFIGNPVVLESVVCTPCHSLIHQSIHANESKSPTNGDGFGIGWYGERPEPGIYRDLRPAWSDENLLSLCAQVRSRLFFAHVRAATGTATARANCHPFAHQNCLFMHNGQIGGYSKIRRALEAMIPDSLYPHRTGTTDSEALFLAAIARNAGHDANAAFTGLITHIRALTQAEGIDEPLRFAAAFTNGDTLHAFRWASDTRAPTLYWRQDSDGLLVVSEPFDESKERWNALPQGFALRARAGHSPVIEPFMP